MTPDTTSASPSAPGATPNATAPRGWRERLDNRAQRLYRRGRVDEARSAWLELLELDPDNPSAKAAIERAERVLGNLERLHEER